MEEPPQSSTPSEAIPLPVPPPRRLRLVDYLGIFFGITTVIAFALAWYWHAQSVQERVPTYYVSPERARIVDTSVPAPPQLQVLYKGKDLNANVSAAIVYFWNDGKLPIKSEDVLEPLKIELDPACEIIDARILKVSRGVTKFAKGDVSDNAKNVLPVSFGILERNDGAVLQIIYAGRSDARISVSGTVVGASATRETKSFERRAEDPRHQIKIELYMVPISGLVLLAVILFYYREFRKDSIIVDVLPKWLRYTAAIGINGTLLAIIVFTYYDYRALQPVVPHSIWMS